MYDDTIACKTKQRLLKEDAAWSYCKYMLESLKKWQKLCEVPVQAILHKVFKCFFINYISCN